MSQLRDTLSKYISATQKNLDPEIHEMVLEKMEDRITKEIIQQEAEKIHLLAQEKRQKEIEQEKEKKFHAYTKAASEAFWTAVILALLVGIAVNQITELILMTKGDNSLPGTWGTIVIIVVLVYIVFKIVFINQIERYIDEHSKDKVDSDE